MGQPVTLQPADQGLLGELDAQGEGAAQLRQWQREGRELAFVYARSLGGLMQTGRCKISKLSGQYTTIDATGSRLVILLEGASYELGPQQFFTPGLAAAFAVPGVAVRLANHDWFFLSAETMPGQAVELLAPGWPRVR
ncbi:hypothetical protein [Massilia sp. MS-15]|uniref:hypothetical protein n=1 Tax=Massilia sp. MS-15 TaxID=2878200 RepID=UPI001CD3D7A2|nr:hypothetical protein [Massilia sp. MS-15]MCA1248637.1 hypothetical protein [Massilia sp. MS-15]